MDIISFSRIYLLYLLFNVAGWVYFAYLMNYTNYITTDNCNNNSKDLTNVIRIFVGFSMTLTTVNIGAATNNILHNRNDLSIIIDNLYCLFMSTLFFLSVAGISGFTLFCMTSAMTDIKCSSDDAEFGLKIAIYGVIWITFIEMFMIFSAIMYLLCNIIIDAKLHLLFYSCVNICKGYRERRIGIEPVIPKYDKNHVLVPISSLKEDNKILCSVCYDDTITLLLEPCNHICICELCYNSLIAKQCPICKTQILTTKKVYFMNVNPI